MEAELAKASHWNSQVGGPFHRCDMMLSKYTEHVGQLGDRWRRINAQIDTRYVSLSLIFVLQDGPHVLAMFPKVCHIKAEDLKLFTDKGQGSGSK